MSSTDGQPISAVVWRDREELHANSYNPNHVAPTELDLLEVSILADGWTQPIVIRTDCEIVDGFHRWTVSGRPRVFSMTDGMVPTVTLRASLSLAEQKLATIRHNRARGVHGVKPMVTIVQSLIEDGISDARLCDALGMDPEELKRFRMNLGMPVSTGKAEFGKGWVPR